MTALHRPRLLAAAPTHWAAGPLGYTAALALAAKCARVLELSLRSSSLKPWLILPAVIGQDLVLLATAGLVGYLLAQLRHPRLRLWLTVIALIPVALVLPADVLSHKLTGRPITFQRLRGDEGATLADLHLLAITDLCAGLLGIAIALAAIAPALRYAPRSELLRRWARPRPLLVTLILGFSCSMAQAALLPRTQGLAEQPLFVLLASFSDPEPLTGYALTQRQWDALHVPDQPLPPAPPVIKLPATRPKNVVIFLAEGVPFKATDFDPSYRRQKLAKRGKQRPDPTPLLYRRYQQHGYLFDRYYANWHASIQALFSIVCSAFPPLGGDIVREKPRIDCGELSQVMRARGVTTGLFHSGEFNFYNKLALLGRRAYAVELDAEEMRKTSKRETHQWGIDDRAMVDATLEWVDSLPRDKRFAALMIAVTPHYPYWVPKDFNRPFKGTAVVDRFLNGVAFLDTAFEQLLQGFEKRGLYDDTLFVWLGDHGHYAGEHERATTGMREFYEPNLHVALVMLNSQLFPASLPLASRVSSRLGSHEDLLPTVLDAIGLPSDPRYQGRSLFAPSFEQRRVFFGAEDGRFVGFLEGDHKFVVDTVERRTEYYNLHSDPGERTDLSDRFPDRMTRYSEDAILFARGAQARVDSAPVLKEKVSVANLYELFMKRVAVQYERDGKRERCAALEAGGAECPGLGKVLRVESGVLAGEQRRCVMVAVPAKGSLELAVKDPDTLDLLTGTILAMRRPKDETKFRIDADADGNLKSTLYLSKSAASARVHHPKAQHELRFEFFAGDPVPPKPVEICLQLTKLYSE